MNYKKIVKVFICFIYALSILVFDFSNNTFMAYAKTQNENKGALEEYLQYQAEQNRTELSAEIEEQLNEDGLFDEEIESLSDEAIEMLEEDADYMISYLYGEIIEDENGNCTVKELTEEEIDDFVVEEYGEEYGCVEDNDILDILGFGREQVKGATTKYNQDNKVVSTKFKHSILMAKNKNKSYYEISYISTWTKAPTFKYKDLMGFKVEGATLDDTETVKAYAWVNYLNSKGKTVSHTFSCLGDMKYTSNNLATKVRLDKYTDNGVLYGAIKDSDFSNCTICLSGHYTKKKKANSIIVTSEYWHQRSVLSVSPGISFDASDNKKVFSFSASVKKKMEELSPNCYLKWKI